MNLVPVMDDVTSRTHRHSAVGIELLAGPDPPSTRQNHEEAIVGMKMGPTHIAWQPFEAHDVGARLTRIAEQHGRLVGSCLISHPLDFGRSLKIDSRAVDI